MRVRSVCCTRLSRHNAIDNGSNYAENHNGHTNSGCDENDEANDIGDSIADANDDAFNTTIESADADNAITCDRYCNCGSLGNSFGDERITCCIVELRCR